MVMTQDFDFKAYHTWARFAWWRRCITTTLLVIASILFIFMAVGYYILASTIDRNYSESRSAIERRMLANNYSSSAQNAQWSNTDMGLDLSLWQAPEEIRTNFPYFLSGYDRQNSPVWIVPFGKYQLIKYFDVGGKEADKNAKILEKYTDQFYYRLQQSRLHRPRPSVDPNLNSSITATTTTSFVIICDLEEYSLSQFASIPTIAFLSRMARKFEGPVSEIEYGFILNLDWGSQMLVTIARPILSAALEKMEMIGPDKSKYIEKILKKISPNQLPQQYGGTNKDFTPVASYG